MGRLPWALLVAAASMLDAPSVFEPGVGSLVVHDNTATADVPSSPSGRTVDLSVPGYAEAVLVVPPSRDEPLPVVVATHGAWDRAEWHCGLWQGIVQDRAFVLCPRGRPTDVRVSPEDRYWYYPDHLALGREITAALAALHARYGGRVDVERPLYVGFSQGAIDGALLLPNHAARFARAILVEGGNGEFDEWGTGPARTLARRGGERVVIACGRAHCDAKGRQSAALLRGAGLSASVVYVPGAGHTYGGPMESALRDAFAWLIAGDARWE